MILRSDTRLPCEIAPGINFNERQDKIDILLLHYTGMPDGLKAQEWLCGAESEVSCHYIVHEDGHVVQMVAEEKRAWHAGRGSWQGGEDVNSRSIGIEIVNPGHELGYPDFPEAQILSVINLCSDIIARHAIDQRKVLAHSDIAPARKRDPGEKFPWRELFEHGVGHWVEPTQINAGSFLTLGDQGEPVKALQKMLAQYGYGVEETGEYDLTTKQVVTAFQRHFRVDLVDGVADKSTIDTIYRLLI